VLINVGTFTLGGRLLRSIDQTTPVFP